MAPRPRFDRRAPVRELPNINDRINYPKLRVVDADGTQLGVISRDEALDVARERELDLVLVGLDLVLLVVSATEGLCTGSVPLCEQMPRH